MSSILAKIILAPFAALYGLGVSFRNFAYNNGLLKGITFNLPIISVGNLSVGGSGKTPHTEYLIRGLKDYLNIATLSRGYGRTSKGFRVVYPNHTAKDVGDEPLQFRRKFPDLFVAVSESRSVGISEIVAQQPETQLILLDDAFQHRAVTPGLNILLTEWSNPFTRDHLLPVGRLREWRGGYERADIIVVSKCPLDLRADERRALVEEIAPKPHQEVFFSFYDYGTPYYVFNAGYRVPLDANMDVLLISAIAQTEYLLNYLEENVKSVTSIAYPDHHDFTRQDIGDLKNRFDNYPSPRKIILTTEKDAVRLQQHRQFLLEHRLPIFALPVEVDFLDNDRTRFDARVQKFLLNFRV